MIAILGTDMPNIEEYLDNCYYKTKTICGLTVYLTVKNCTKILIANLGTSKVYSAVNLSIIVQNFCPKAIIFVGNLAEIDGQNLNSIVIGQSNLQFDVNFTLLNYNAGEIPPLNKTTFTSDPHLVGIAESASIALNLAYTEGLIITADQFIGNTLLSQSLKTIWNANAIDAESGALAQTAFMLEIPFVVVKGVSNFANDNAVTDYNSNVLSANRNAFNVAMQMINLIQTNNYQYCSCN